MQPEIDSALSALKADIQREILNHHGEGTGMVQSFAINCRRHTIPTDPENQYGLWNPTRDGQRNGCEVGQRLMTASAEEITILSAKIEDGKVEVLRMLDSRNACEVSIGAYHRACYIELENWVARATARAAV